VVEAGTTVEGEVRGEGDLVVRGSLRGRVSMEGTVRLEPGSDVEADVRAPRVVIVDGAAFRGSLDTLGGETAVAAGSPAAPAAPADPDDPLSALRRRIRLRGE
jgi:cytoskeletal protein CcmA (bactofilin family)